MGDTCQFNEVARLPLPGDNAAVAIRSLDAGTVITYEGRQFTLDYTVMEGHRFAVQAIAPGEPLLSWELPFGTAIRPIRPGNYVVNETVLDELRVRDLRFPLPAEPNFNDQLAPFVLDEATFQPAPVLPLYPETRTFLGYRRDPARGVGTRNYVVLLGTTSRTGSYVKQLAARLQGELSGYPGVDGIVPAAHTEGATEGANNQSLLVRTLAGFLVNPNVGAVLVVDYGDEPVTNRMVEDYAREKGYPLGDVPHRFLSLKGSFDHSLAKGERIVREWLPTVNAMERTEESIAHLKIGMQCGGSDAFSGISANPMLGWLARELVRFGGSANLAETDELIGAEPYVLGKVRDIGTARRFLELVDTFKVRTSWHGTSAEGNPSGGNKYRGLYNIYLKSIGAARKKDPDTRLDHVIDYGEPMAQPGFYFMDSPGNDLESIAGQVAAGCNLIFFTTGNGSITNFPFVPTVKIVTTTARYELLSSDMDLNAGKYLEGVGMDELGKEAFELTVRVASGERSVGEKAGHAQVQIWRNWQQSDGSRLASILQAPQPTGRPIPIRSGGAAEAVPFPFRFTLTSRGGHPAGDHIALILPTSLCAGQVGGMIAERLNQSIAGKPAGVSRFVSLAHTEGCGCSGGSSEQLYARTMLGYAAHPLVRHCLLLEHGCEKTHNEYMRHHMQEMGIDPSHLGYASIQLDGGIDKVTQKVEKWFEDRLAVGEPATPVTVGLESLRIGLLADGPISDADGEQLAKLTQMIVHAGGTIVVPAGSSLLSSPSYRDRVLTDSDWTPSLAYGEHARLSGFHIMETPTGHWVETVTGVAATGVELLLTLANRRPMQAHPFVPMLQIASDPSAVKAGASDLDLTLAGDSTDWTGQILQRVKDILEHTYTPRLQQMGNTDFQLTRGLLGISL